MINIVKLVLVFWKELMKW